MENLLLKALLHTALHTPDLNKMISHFIVEYSEHILRMDCNIHGNNVRFVNDDKLGHFSLMFPEENYRGQLRHQFRTLNVAPKGLLVKNKSYTLIDVTRNDYQAVHQALYVCDNTLKQIVSEIQNSIDSVHEIKITKVSDSSEQHASTKKSTILDQINLVRSEQIEHVKSRRNKLIEENKKNNAEITLLNKIVIADNIARDAAKNAKIHNNLSKQFYDKSAEAAKLKKQFFDDYSKKY